MDIRQQTYKENFEKYDISSYEGLIYYEKNGTIHPALKDSLTQSLIFYNSLLKEKFYNRFPFWFTISFTKWWTFLYSQILQTLICHKQISRTHK